MVHSVGTCNRHSGVLGMQEMIKQTSACPRGTRTLVVKLGNSYIKQMYGRVMARQTDRQKGRKQEGERKKERWAGV